MDAITLDKIHEDLIGLKKDIEHIKAILEEDFELPNELIQTIEKSRKRPMGDFVSHEEMRKEFG